jgi:hypothetical protein
VRFLAFLLLSVLVSGTAGAQVQPTLAAKSRSVEIEVNIDPNLRDDGRLHRELLKDSQRFIDKWKREADKEWRSDKIMFRNGPWSVERHYHFDAAAGPYVGLSILDYSYTGGAHPNQRTTSILWDREQGKRVNVAVMFNETKPGGPTTTALARLIREEVAKEKRERDVEVTEPLAKDQSLSAIKADLRTFGAPGLVRSTIQGKIAGIDFHFSAYDVGAYAEGAYGAYLPWQVLEPFLAERARALFGGARRDEGNETKN